MVSIRKRRMFNRDRAKTDAVKSVTAALHGKLKAAEIWARPTGDIEYVLGLAGDRSEAALPRKSLLVRW